MNKQYCVISHTHWDREWYQPFDQFRMRLVDLLDNVLDIFAEDERYVFHMDAQTVVLEDYLEIRPTRRGELERYIRNGQLIVGPWYVQNDFYLSSGESTVRNLLIGTDIATSYGRCSRVGYCPDQFGLVGQLPQILSGFAVDNVVFGRGNRPVSVKDGRVQIPESPCELHWQGADGTTAKGISMSRWYNNAQRFSEDLDTSLSLVAMNERGLSGLSVVPFRLMMNGVDHLEAQENLLPILERLNARLDNACIYQGRLEEYVKQTFDYIKENECCIPTVVGELRGGTEDMILEGTLSSRVYLKQANDLCEDILAQRLEPLYEMLTLRGISKAYPRDYLRYLWKELVKNHAHDSICGCSNDAVHRQMEERFLRIQQTAEELISRGMRLATLHRDVAVEGEGYILTLANTTADVRTATVETDVYFPISEQVANFCITDKDGNDIPFVCKAHTQFTYNSYSPINLPGTIRCDKYRIAFVAEDMQPYSFRYLTVTPISGERKVETAVPVDGRTVENTRYRIVCEADNTLTLYDKDRERMIRDFLCLEDTADVGHSYNFRPLAGDVVRTAHTALSACEVETDALQKTLRLRYDWSLPKTADPKRRSEEMCTFPVEITIRLTGEDGHPEIGCRFTNESDNHRLRLRVRTGLKTDTTKALSAFELVERRLGADYVPSYRGADQPNAGLILLEDEKGTAALYNRGLHEYEHATADGDILITLLRSTGSIVSGPALTGGADWTTPDGQCHRTIEVRIVLAYGEDSVDAVRKLYAVRNPLLVHFDSVDGKKFTGGRPTLQGSNISEQFYRADAWPNVVIAGDTAVLTVDNPAMAVTAFKRAEKNNGHVLRLFNTTQQPQSFCVRLPEGVTEAALATLAEERKATLTPHNGLLPLTAKVAEICTIWFR